MFVIIDSWFDEFFLLEWLLQSVNNDLTLS